MSFRTQSGAAVTAAIFGFVASLAMLVSTTAWGQGIPGKSVNIIGPTPDIDYMLPDTGLKQQNEVGCAVRPGEPLVAFCGYNDYRTTEKTGDAWVGVSMTRDGGLTWSSRLAPGWPQYATPGAGTPVGHDFAADPNAAAVPGLVLYNFIAADRGKKGTGGLFLQRWFESDKENGFPYVPSQDTILITKGTSCPQCSGRFIDKPHMIAALNPAGDDVAVTGTLEDGTSKTATVPAGELHVVYSVFTGSKQDSSKILHSVSKDWGTTWSVDSKITESVDVNQSANLVARGDDLLVVWRRFSDNNESNALMYSVSNDRGDTWGPPEVLAQLSCPYDQPTRTNMFRTTVHPVAATDGSAFYTFWSTRGVEQTLGAGTDASGNPIPADEMNCLFGLSRIVMSKSLDGVTWSDPVPVDMTAKGIGHQFMPSVASANGMLQVAWYDSRDSMLPVHNEGVMDGFFIGEDGNELPPPYVARHSVDVRGKQIAGSLNSESPSVRLSRYPLFPLTPDLSLQLGFNFVNARMFAGGKVPFVGDYISVAAPSFRLDSGGNWEDNQGPGALEPPSFYAAWTDNRDVRGDAWGDVFNAATVYSSNANIPPKATNDLEQGTETNYTPGVCVAGAPIDRTRDQNVYATTIKPGAVLTLPTRNKRLGPLQRGYVVNVENAERRNEQEFTFCIDGQPGDYTGDAGMTGLASFSQFPAPISGFGLGSQIDPVTTLNVSVPAQSNSAQSVYVTSTIDFPHIPVSVYKGNFQCEGTRGELVSTIVINGDKLARSLDEPNPDPVTCTPAVFDEIGNVTTPPECIPQADDYEGQVANVEIHDPEIINYIWALYHVNADLFDDYAINSGFQQGLVINPLIMTKDGTTNPLVMTRDVTNPLIMTKDGTTNPLIMTRDDTSNPLIMTRDSTTNPLIMTRDDTTNPLIMTSGKETNPLIMTKDGGTNPLIMTRDDVDNPLVMTLGDVDNPLIMTRDAYDNPLIMTKDDLSNPLIMTKDADGNVINPLIMTRDSVDNPLIMTKDAAGNPLIMTRDGAGNPLIMTYGADGGRVAVPASAFCTQEDIAADTCDLPEGYVEVTWLVENSGNTITAYNALPMIAGGSLVDADGNLIPTQLVVTKPYLTYASRGCVPGMAVINQLLLNTSNPFLENEDGSWRVDPGKATFFSGPGEEITITLRIFDPTFNPNRLGFSVQSQSCNSDELGCVVEPEATIVVDVTPPGEPVIGGDLPEPLDYLDAEGSDGAFAEWFATSTDDDGSAADVSCVASFGDQTVDVFFDDTTGTFSAVFPTGVINADESYTATTVTCTATDSTGNTSSANFEVLVLDVTPPVLTSSVTDDTPEATSPAGAVVDFTLEATDFGVGFTLNPETTSCSAVNTADASLTIASLTSGDTVPMGSWLVTCSGQDIYGNVGTTSFTVTIADTTAPSFLAIPDDISVEATSSSGAAVEFALPAATDAVGVTELYCVPASGSTFSLVDPVDPVPSDVICTARDAAGNTATTSFQVTVVDTTAPVFEPVLADLTGSTTGLADSISFTPVAWDYARDSDVNVVDTAVDIACSYGAVGGDVSGYTALTAVGGTYSHDFPVGETAVNCSATDDHGNRFEDIFLVTVGDIGLPVVTVPSDITEEATGPDGAAAYFDATAEDLISGTLAATCSITVDGVSELLSVDDDVASATYGQFNDVFPLGTTEVTCSATDLAGNTAEASFDVTVEDTTAPVLTVTGNPSAPVEATGFDGAPVTFNVDVLEVVTTGLSAICTDESDRTVASGVTAFAIGSHTVNCSATDGVGLEGTATFNFEVVDTTVPVLNLVAPTDLTPEATSSDGAQLSFSVTASDVAWVDVGLSCESIPATELTIGAGGSVSAQFALGTTTVTCTATDGAGLSTQGSFTATVEDTTNPTLTLSAPPATHEATSAAGKLVSYSVYATDTVGDVALVCETGSGDVLPVGTELAPSVSYQFPLGTTNVTCTATDGSASTAPVIGSFPVTVQDTTAPVLTLVKPSEDPIGVDSLDGARVSYSVSAADVDDVSAVTLECTNGSGDVLSTGVTSELFAMGETTVTCTASDAAGNSATDSFIVKIHFAEFLGMDIPNGMSIEGGNGDTRLDLEETALGSYSRSIPLYWQYGDTSGAPIDSGSADPTAHIDIFGRNPDGSCAFLATPINAEDSGNSAMRYTSSSQSWKYSWKPSYGAGCYGITIQSGLTGQEDGPYLFELR